MPKLDFQISLPTAQMRLGGSRKAASPAPAHSNRTLLMRSIGGGCGQLEKRFEFRGCLELRDWVEVLECTREGVGQAPQCSRSELLDPRVEILVVNAPGQVFWGVELAFHERLVDDQLGGIVRKARPLPRLDLFPYRLEVPLHTVYPNREDVHEAQMLGVLGEHGCERARDNVAKLRAREEVGKLFERSQRFVTEARDRPLAKRPAPERKRTRHAAGVRCCFRRCTPGDR